MKVKKLMKLLSECDPKATVSIVYRDDNHKEQETDDIDFGVSPDGKRVALIERIYMLTDKEKARREDGR